MSGEIPIDWEGIRHRVDDMEARSAQSLNPSREEELRILKTRARELAREPEAARDAHDLLEVVEFELAGERYGLALTSVREVCVLKELTPVPCTPPFVLGIMNLRGEIHTVIDLKRFFDLPDAGITQLNRVLIIGGEDMRLGLLADAIRGVRALTIDQLQTSLPTLTGTRANYLRGVTSERLIVLDAGKIVSDKAVLVDEEAGS